MNSLTAYLSILTNLNLMNYDHITKSIPVFMMDVKASKDKNISRWVD